MKTLFLLLFPTLLFAQNCKYEKNEVDKFTNDTTIITRKVVISAQMGTIQCQGISLNNYRSVRLIITMFKSTFVNEGDNFMIIDDLDSMITLSAIYQSIAEYKGGAWSLVSSYGLSDDQIVYFIDRQIKSIRIYTSSGYIETDIKEKHAIKFKDTLRCIQSPS